MTKEFDRPFIALVQIDRFSSFYEDNKILSIVGLLGAGMILTQNNVGAHCVRPFKFALPSHRSKIYNQLYCLPQDAQRAEILRWI